MHVTGHCYCGDIQYEAEVREDLVTICHCTSCQRNSGTAFGVVVPTSIESFKLLAGTLSSYESVADSGTLRSRTFCAKCGTRIHARSVGETTESGVDFVGLRVGTVDQRSSLTPVVQVWCRSALPWAIVD